MSGKVLSVCSTCRFAAWKQTANGRRHPDGSGRCTFEFPDSQIPKWLYQRTYGRDSVPIKSLRALVDQQWQGRWIYWVESHSTVAEPCATYEAKS